MLVWWCCQFLSNGYLPQSRLSANDKGDKMKPEAVHKSLGIYLTAEENPGELQLGNCLMEAMGMIIILNGIPYFQITSIREGEWRKERLMISVEMNGMQFTCGAMVFLFRFFLARYTHFKETCDLLTPG